MTQGDLHKLAALFSGIDKKILMDKFDDKLEIQKTTYIAQEYGINLGYQFEWYLRGPYCKQVSEDAHKILDSEIKIKTPKEIGLDEQKIKQFKEILKPHINDTEWLEIAGSLLYLRKEHYPDKPLDQIIGFMLEDLTYGYKNFSEQIVRKVLSDMLRIKLIN